MIYVNIEDATALEFMMDRAPSPETLLEFIEDGLESGELTVEEAIIYLEGERDESVRVIQRN